MKITTERSVRRIIRKHDPDVVISVHPLMTSLPVTSCQKISSETGRHLPIFTVVTDLGSGHCTWFDKGVEKMFIGSHQIRELAIKRGKVPEEKLVMSGLPIRQDFAFEAARLGHGGRTSMEGQIYQLQVRDKLGIIQTKEGTRMHTRSERKVLLVMEDGEGVGSLSSIVDSLYIELVNEGIYATILVVCGRNSILKESLETRDWNGLVSQAAKQSTRKGTIGRLKGMAYLPLRAYQQRRKDSSPNIGQEEKKDTDVVDGTGEAQVLVHPLGFVTNMAEYMVAAHVLVTKAGPGTIVEAASVGLPVMLTSFLPGECRCHAFLII